MPGPLVYPLIQGVKYDFSSLDVKLGGVSYLGVKAVDWNDGLEPGKGYGTSAQKLFSTRGQYDADGSLELWYAESDVFEAQLIQQNPNTGLYEIRFPIDITLNPEGGLAATTNNLVGARLKKRTVSPAQGNEAISVKYDLDLMYVIKNGIAPLTNMLR